jgi:phosphoribosylformimino-5-aminoimidazole carboxamide ribotide isomerase
MEIIPVLDLARGIAVHARAGERAGYQPLRSVLLPDCVGDPVALIRTFRERLGAERCYVADLDAIVGGPLQSAVLRRLAQREGSLSASLLVDAGIHSPDAALELLSLGVSDVVVGLETLRAFAELAAVLEAVGSHRVVFSLDLRMGHPILHSDRRQHSAPSPAGFVADGLRLATEAVDTGATRLLLLDLGRVGTGEGVDLGLLEALRRRFPHVQLFAGGGVRSRLDLDRLRAAGCDAALVASALHDGSITATDMSGLIERTQSGASASR